VYIYIKIADGDNDKISILLCADDVVVNLADFQEIAKNVAMSASRALGLIISKIKTFGGFK
jgi:hypothetical protein